MEAAEARPSLHLSNCWKSHAAAQFYLAFLLFLGSKKGRNVGQQADEIVTTRT